MRSQRSKLILMNMVFGIVYEAVLAISGILIPRYILASYGSSVNGLVSSIAQFLSFIALLKGGIGGVTRAALYKPLSEGNKDGVDRILKATQLFLQKISFIFLAAVLVFASVYYFFVAKDGFSWLYCFLLVLIISLGTFAQYFFGMTSQLLLQADQKGYVYYIFQTIATALIIGVCIGLIFLGRTIHEVKLATAIIYGLCPVALFIYTKKKYRVNFKVEPDNNSIKQRWNAFGYQTATYVHENTDIVLLTFFCPLLEVSVYSVHSLVINSCIRKVLETLFGGFDAAIGDIYARKETKNLINIMDVYGVGVAILSAAFFGCALFLMPSFIPIYTSGVNDVSYTRPIFLAILVAAEFIFCLRMPFYSLITSLGRYKETRAGAYIEAIINIVISLSLIWWLGIIGVAIGTLVAMFFRWIYMIVYSHKHIMKQKIGMLIKQLIASIIIFTIAFFATHFIQPWSTTNMFAWFSYALVIFIIVISLSLVVSFVFFKNQTKTIFGRFLTLFRRN